LKIRYCQFFYLAYNIKKKEKKEKGGRAIGKNRLYATVKAFFHVGVSMAYHSTLSQ